MKKTTWRKTPILIAGYDIQRWERPGGAVLYRPEHNGVLAILEGSKDGFGPTHLQYDSPWGFLLTWPLCFHFWIQFRKQQSEPNPNYPMDNGSPTRPVPGSERVLYLRIGWARWDAYDSCYLIPTFYLGGHWD